MDRAIRYAIVLVIAGFFSVMWGLHIRRHVRFWEPTRLRPDYDRLLAPGEDERSMAWDLYFGGRRIGRSESHVERDSAGMLVIRTSTRIGQGGLFGEAFGLSGPLDVDFEARVGPLRGLEYFSLSSETLTTRIDGIVSGDAIGLSGHVGDDPVAGKIPYDQDRFLGQVFAPLTFLPDPGEVRVGDRWPLHLVNPLSGTLMDVAVEVAGKAEVDLAGGSKDVFELAFVTPTSRWASWVTEDGEVLVQGTPFAISLRRAGLPASVLAALEVQAAER